ncbi:uncharacterized protein IUM83_13671 [Phytophthora cinnamomi]|uniref:uncharacterized protein n=1 Tax=Phytophthora cinnamomi TaxID=4785 RepID=UPI003559E9A6|nr:hypothetical protein IUM83_13671 [Phytophthora cinnamomi]
MLLMMASNSIHLILAVRAIFHQINVAKTNEEVLTLDGQPTPTQLHYFRDLPGMIRSIFGDTEISHARSRRIRVFAPFPLPLSDESVAFMNEITRIKRDYHAYSSSRILISGRLLLEPTARTQSYGHVQAKRERVQVSPQQNTRMITTVDEAKLNQVAPVSATASLSSIALQQHETFSRGSSSRRLLALTNSDPTLSSKVLCAALVHSSTEEVVWDALQALFHSEYLLMAEYIECALPLLYAAYLAVLFHLPSAQYYPYTAFSSHKLVTNVTNIVIFGAVEYAGFVGLLFLLKREFGVSPLYQLAFVLETQARSLQGHLFVWTIFILHMPLTHYGVDFNVPFGTL